VIDPTTTTSTEATVPPERFEYINKEVIVNAIDQNQTITWDAFKNALANSTNQFIEKYNLNYMPAT
jgi:hypothetical protein